MSGMKASRRSEGRALDYLYGQHSITGDPIQAKGGRQQSQTVIKSSKAAALFRPDDASGTFYSMQEQKVSISLNPQQIRAEVLGQRRAQYFQRPRMTRRSLEYDDSRPSQDKQPLPSGELNSSVSVAMGSLPFPSDSPTVSVIPQSGTSTEPARTVPLSNINLLTGEILTADNGANGSGAANSAPVCVDACIGTMYRESSSQTFPYSPDVITSSTLPYDQSVVDLLSIADWTVAGGQLPASVEELDALSARRERARWEASLPPISGSEASFEVRKRLVLAREMEEWSLKEEERKKQQELRMTAFQAALLQRQQEIETANQQRVDWHVAEEKEIIEWEGEKREKQRRARIRRLGKERLAQEHKLENLLGVGCLALSAPSSTISATGLSSSLPPPRPDRIFSSIDYSSNLYAPVAYEGRRRFTASVVDYDIPQLQTYDTLEEIHNKMNNKDKETARQKRKSMKAVNHHIKQPIRPTSAPNNPNVPSHRSLSPALAALIHLDGKIQAQREARLQLQSERPNAVLEQRSFATRPSAVASGAFGKLKGLATPGYSNVYKRFSPLERAVTPTVEAEEKRRSLQSKNNHQRNGSNDLDYDNVSCEEAVLFLQRLLRGRALENEWLAGREKAEPLIRHFKKSYRPLTFKSSTEEKQEDKETTTESSAEPIATSTTSSDSAPESAGACMEVLVGSLVTDTLVFLTEEKNRREQIAALAAIRMKAKEERRRREAEEGGRRQKEAERKAEENRKAARELRIATTHSQSIIEHILDTSTVEAASRKAQKAAEDENSHPIPKHDSVEQTVSSVLRFAFTEAIRLQQQTERNSLSRHVIVGQAHEAIKQILNSVVLREEKKDEKER